MRIPSLILKQLYTFGSLRNSGEGVAFKVKNRLTDVTLLALHGIKIDGKPVPLDKIILEVEDEAGSILTPAELKTRPLFFPLRQVIQIVMDIPPLEPGKHKIEIEFEAK
ncbi:MAG TPA: hydroxymethylglutaryl-CoA reductase, partial [Caldilineae bacterium]|nr:hydroxymethylglutaryl-CoA reductase [Caldilineae bacterium]